MHKLIRKYQLKTGLLLSVLFPGIFVFSQPIDSLIIPRIFFSFLTILTMWVINFELIDFSQYWIKNTGFEKKRLYKRIALSFLCVIGIYLLIGFIDKTGLLLTQIKGKNMYSAKAWFFLILRISLFNALFILIKYLFDSNAEKRRKEMEIEVLKRENIIALHESLKQQISPHFLFNSLNTLKSLVKQDRIMPLIFIDELASVYRYMLNHNGRDEVTMNEEIIFLKSYLHLLQLRFGESIVTKIEIPDNFLSTKIPPNTLQILIENAVKHNVLSSQKPLRISITASCNYLMVENNLQPKKPESSSSYVGLSNIDSRYKILKGKNIIIERDDAHFKVLLPVL